MTFELPPIVNLAERLMVEIEEAVRRFPRYHKYASGAVLREQAMKVAQLAHRAWRDRARLAEWVSRLVVAIDNLKLTMQLAKRVHAFKGFKQFEALALIGAELGRQAGGWSKHVHPTGQNGAAANRPQQRPKTLSTRAASREANP